MPITDRQQQVLEFIRRFQRDSGCSPSLADIANHFDFGSTTAAAKLVARLVEQGAIEREEGSRRGIRIPAAERLAQTTLPVLGRIAAGSPITATGNIESRVAVDPALFRPAADLLHRVSGDSMVDVGVLSGDLVGIHLQPTAPNGSIVAACLLDEKTGDELITLKRYTRKRDIVTLTSENASKSYPPIVIDLARPHYSQSASRFRLAGIMAGLIRSGAPR